MRFVSTALLLIFLIVSTPFCFAAQYNLSYDANGNLVSGDGYYRVYNSLNQLWKIYNGTSSSGLLLEEYIHNPMSERIDMKTVYDSAGGVKETTYYWSDDFRTLVNSSGEFNITSVYHEGQLIAETTNGVTLFMHTDLKGNIVAVTNSSGALIENNSYSPYGEILSGGSKSKLGYEAKEYDPVVKDVDFHFRKYNPSWWIFLQPDTLIQNVYDPQLLNRYMFERGNPQKNTDPTGHRPGDVGGINQFAENMKYYTEDMIKEFGSAVNNANQAATNWFDTNPYARGGLFIYDLSSFIPIWGAYIHFPETSINIMFGLEAANNGKKGISASEKEVNSRIVNGAISLSSMPASSLSGISDFAKYVDLGISMNSLVNHFYSDAIDIIYDTCNLFSSSTSSSTSSNEGSSYFGYNPFSSPNSSSGNQASQDDYCSSHSAYWC